MRRRVAAAVAGLVLAFVLGSANAGAVGVLQLQSGGFGHGIGMSQYGADGYALHGKSYTYILAHYYRGTRIGVTNPGQLVRVLLSNSSHPSFSGASVADGTVQLKPAISYTVQPAGTSGALELTWTAIKKHKLAHFTLGPFTGALTATGPALLQLAGKGTYHGTLVFRSAGGPDVETVDALALDDHVRGVVAAEIPSTWPTQALEAQAVAARTYALTADAGGAVFNVYDDTRSQMYGGVGAETAATDAAVRATSGQIVTYDGAPVVAYFFSSSGGHTESIQNEWPGSRPEPWLVGVPDPFDGANGHDPYHHVVHEMSIGAAAARLSGLVKGALIGVRVLKHGVSPRVITAEVVGTGGNTIVSGTRLQKRFNLLTNWEVFTALSAVPGAAPGGNGGTASAEAAQAARAATQNAYGVGPQTGAVRALVPLVDAMLVQAIPGLHGQVFPPPARGGAVAVQLREPRGWKRVAYVGLLPGGRFDVALPGRGAYRVRYGQLDTPALNVG